MEAFEAFGTTYKPRHSGRATHDLRADFATLSRIMTRADLDGCSPSKKLPTLFDRQPDRSYCRGGRFCGCSVGAAFRPLASEPVGLIGRKQNLEKENHAHVMSRHSTAGNSSTLQRELTTQCYDATVLAKATRPVRRSLVTRPRSSAGLEMHRRTSPHPIVGLWNSEAVGV